LEKNESLINLGKLCKDLRGLEKKAAEIRDQYLPDCDIDKLCYNTDKLLASINSLEVFQQKGVKKIDKAIAAAFDADRIPFKIGQTLSEAKKKLEKELEEKEQKSQKQKTLSSNRALLFVSYNFCYFTFSTIFLKISGLFLAKLAKAFRSSSILLFFNP